MESAELLTLAAVGLVSGWIASRLVTGRGRSVPGSLALGVVGAFVGPLLLEVLELEAPVGLLGSVATAVIGAGALAVVAGLVGSLTLTLVGAVIAVVVLGGVSLSIGSFGS